MILGELAIVIKITKLPEATTVENNWQRFEVKCDRQTITVTVRPKMWKKLVDAQSDFPEWIASITGKLGEVTSDGGFILLEPSIQVFERKAKGDAAA